MEIFTIEVVTCRGRAKLQEPVESSTGLDSFCAHLRLLAEASGRSGPEPLVQLRLPGLPLVPVGRPFGELW